MARSLTNTSQNLVVFLLVLFCLVFPKAGFKIGTIPITFGYILLSITFILVFILDGPRLLQSVDKNRLLVTSLTLPFALYGLIIFYFVGYDEIGFVISFFVNFAVFPIAFVYILSIRFDKLDMNYLFGMVRHSILVISIYGIFLFFYKSFTGSFIEIPYLTVNSGDLGALESKNISRGDYYKLISTYNNGNIYGVCLLMLLPLFDYIETGFVKRLIVRISLILTLSRTVWIGIFSYEIARLLLSRKKSVSFLLSSLAFFIISIYAISQILGAIGYSSDFLLDKNLGGRAESLNINPTLIPELPFNNISEIVYASVLESFGIIGLILFSFSFFSPLLIFVSSIRNNPLGAYKKRIISGIILYMLLCFSDGAMMLIPTMLIYWFLVALLLMKQKPLACRTKLKRLTIGNRLRRLRRPDANQTASG